MCTAIRYKRRFCVDFIHSNYNELDEVYVPTLSLYINSEGHRWIGDNTKMQEAGKPPIKSVDLDGNIDYHGFTDQDPGYKEIQLSIDQYSVLSRYAEALETKLRYENVVDTIFINIIE